MITLGINHKTAPVSVREKVAFSPEQLPSALQGMRSQIAFSEVAILSTCNRTELYGNQIDKHYQPVIDWLADYHSVARKDIASCVYVHQDEAAVRHMMRVASGLDSMVLGEPQILGQMKQAYNTATEAGTIGSCLGRLFQQTFSVAKQVRTDTEIGSSAVSVAYAAVSLSKHIFDDLANAKALFIGAGETIELAARHLYNLGSRDFIVANRTFERAKQLAYAFNGKAIELDGIANVLPEVDIIFASTGSSLPVLGKGTVESALKQRRRKPIFMVDLAVPRDIEAEVGQLEDVYLYTVDDLHSVIAENLKARTQAAEEAEDIIGYHAGRYMGWLRSQGVVDTICAFRDKFEKLRQDEMARALTKIKQGQPVEEALEQLSSRLTNKFLHQPTTELRRAGSIDDKALIAEFKRWFGFDN